MKLTGQCKEDFEKWFLLSDNRKNFSDAVKTQVGHSILNTFYRLPNSMQYGVLVDFFDSNSFMIGIEPELNNVDRYIFYWIVQSPFGAKESNYTIFHRHQAREEAIKAANDIYCKNK